MRSAKKQKLTGSVSPLGLENSNSERAKNSSTNNENDSQHIVQQEHRPIANRIGNSEIYIYPTIRVGVGSTGTILEGYFMKQNSDVRIKAAVKCIDADRADIYSKEIDIWKQVNSEKVVKLLAYVKFIQNRKTEYYIAMELADATLFKVVCDMKSEVDKETITKSKYLIIKYLRDACEGLEWLFSKNILHRDVKPENILIFKMQEKAKLGDFGYSKQVRSLTGGSLTSGRTTLGWASPEVIEAVFEEKEFSYNKTHDIYSLGLTMYYASYGVHPYGRHEIASNIKNDCLQVDQHDKYYNIIWKMLARDSTKRPDITDVLTDPMFWSNSELIKFMCGVYLNYLNDSNFFDKANEEFLSINPSFDWIKQVPEFESVITNKDQCDNKVSSLVYVVHEYYSPGTPNKFDQGEDFISRVEKFKDLAKFLCEFIKNYKRDSHGGIKNEFMHNCSNNI